VVALEAATRGFSLSGRKSAMAMAMRMARELGRRPDAQEAEWETADRLGYSDAVVRQARRILQDFGMVCCQQGRKGAALAPSVSTTGVIRLLAPCIAASATSVQDNRDLIFFLISCAPVLAARRVELKDSAPVIPFASSSNLDALEALTLENLLLELSGNPLLAIVVRSLGLATVFAADDSAALPDRSDVIATNRCILQAIKTGDVKAAGRLARVKLDAMQRPVDSYWEVA
jgi:DNA-binding FadR family transcriptional regulator